ncbi:MAG: DUF3747 domain-containing protein [Elainella sp. Prado103]|nr:DUF3747 domain-containing protein [Elainella sp. Prado103]
MRMAFWQRLAILAALSWGIGSVGTPGNAAQFEQQEIDSNRFIVLAAPGGELGYKLLILEQIKDNRPCWSETGNSPSQVDPLLLNFDFTGICNRIVDSNGFSVRTAGQDQGLQYSLRILPTDNDLVLVAASNIQRNTYAVIGRTYGMPNGFSRIILEPGWRLTRRTFAGRELGHVYLTYDQPIETLLSNQPLPRALSGRGNPLLQNPTPATGTEGVIPVPSLPPVPPPNSPIPGSAIPNSSGTSASPSISPLPPTPAPGSIAVPNSIDPALSATAPPPPPLPASAESRPRTVTSMGGTATPVERSPQSPPNQSLPNQSLPNQSPPNQSTTNSTTRRFPPTSNGGGAVVVPSTLRRNSTRSTSSTPSSSAPSARTTVAQAEPDTASDDTAETAVAPVETYQVIVVADSAETQDKVRSVAPNAFLTSINGQVVMQVGIFRDRREADRLQQRLSMEGLPTAVIPVR